MYDAENALALPNSHDQELTRDGLVEIRRQSGLKEQSDLSLSLRRGP
jgi:hypothetical protein